MFSHRLRSSKKNDLYPKDWWYFFKPDRPIRGIYARDVRKGLRKPVYAQEAPKQSSVSRNPATTTVRQDRNAKRDIAADYKAQRCGNQPNVQPKTDNVSKVATTPSGIQPAKQTRPAVQSNSKAKRVLPKKTETPKTNDQPATPPRNPSQASGRTKKKLTWADDLENSRSTGIKRSDARIVLRDDTKSKGSHNTGPRKDFEKSRGNGVKESEARFISKYDSNSKDTRNSGPREHSTEIVVKDNNGKKYLAWDSDLENSRGTGIRKSDARIIIKNSIESENGRSINVKKSTARMMVVDDLESNGGLSDSDSSMIDATPANVISRNKNSSSVTAKRCQPAVTEFDFEEVWSDTSTTGSAIDINVGPVRFSFDDNVDNGAHKTATIQGLRTSHPTSIDSIPGPAGHINSKGAKHRNEDSSLTNESYGILQRSMPTPLRQTGQANEQGDHVDEQTQASLEDRSTELRFTTADLRKLKHSDYRPEFVRAVGRGDTPNLESPGPAADRQDEQVERAIQAAESNAKRNRGPLLDNASLKPAKGVRRSSLELARRKAAASNHRPMEPRSQRIPDSDRPIFAFRPNKRKDDREMQEPIFVIRTQRDLEKLREDSNRVRRQPSSPSHQRVSTRKHALEEHGGNSRIQSRSLSSYKRPSVSDEIDR